MKAAVVTTPEAEAQIRAIDAWWRQNRPAAPDLFSEEIAAAFELLGGAPMAGRQYAHPSVKEVRRLLLRTTRYHVYYRLHADSVIILAVWSAVRGAGPALGGPLPSP